MNRRFSVTLVAIIAMSLGVGVGTGCQSQPAGNAAGSTPVSSGQQSQAVSSGGQNQANGNLFMRQGSLGTVDDLSPNGFTLVLQNGNGHVPVVTDSKTRVTKMSEGKVSDLKVGDEIVAMGTQQGDGTLAVSAIQAGIGAGQRGAGANGPGGMGQGGQNSQGGQEGQNGPAGQGGQGGQRGQYQGGQGGQGGQRGQYQGNGSNGQMQRNPQAGQQGAQTSADFGQIESIDGNTITLKVPSGSSSKVTVDTNTVVRKSVDGTFSDLKAGQMVMVNGERNDKGAIVAVSVELVPASMIPAGQ